MERWKYMTWQVGEEQPRAHGWLWETLALPVWRTEAVCIKEKYDEQVS